MKSRHRDSRHTRHKSRRTRRPIGPDGSALAQRIGNSHCPVPEKLFCVLPYASGPYNLNQSGGNQFAVFRANSPYDPQYSIGGTTAAYFSELGLAYQQYTCHGSRIKVYVTPNTSADTPAVCSVFPAVSGTVAGSLSVPADYAAMLVMPQAKWCQVQTYDKSMAVVDNKVLIKDYVNDEADVINYQANAPGFTKTLASGSNPTTAIYWVIAVYAPDGLVGDANVWVTAEIEYFVEFHTRTVPYGYNNESKVELIDIKGKPIKAKEPVEPPPSPPEDDIMSDSVFIDKLKSKLKL